MCGLLFQYSQENKLERKNFNNALSKMQWRGSGFSSTLSFNEERALLGNQEKIKLSSEGKEKQVLTSSCGDYAILLDGEIYNHRDIRSELPQINWTTSSSSETVIEAFKVFGKEVFCKLDGMFAIIIYDVKKHSWVAARDAFGIKPLYKAKKNNQVILGSEPAIIADMVDSKHSSVAIKEWEIIRRPLPGFSFFDDVYEILPGTIETSDELLEYFWVWEKSKEGFEQEKFEQLLSAEINKHKLGDAKVVSLMSGGLDSAIISALSGVEKCYTIGLTNNNEFIAAKDSASYLQIEIDEVVVTEIQLLESWKHLTRLRREPLSLPNEGLIYLVCKAISSDETIVLTGEGADELLFGYDGIFRWALSKDKLDAKEFLLKYGYSSEIKSERLLEYLDDMNINKMPIEFVEDFFYQVHLPGLLRRMDFASMVASKEARVPFVSKELVSYMYRQSPEIKINENFSKIPLRVIAKEIGLEGVLQRKKIGFSAQLELNSNRYDDYKFFRDVVLEELKW